jgi:hypothetical protein
MEMASKAAVPLWKRVPRAALWAIRGVLGVSLIDERLARVEMRVDAVIGALQIVIAHASGQWLPEQRGEVQKHIANFGAVAAGLGTVKPTGNPVTQQELDQLKAYVQRAQQGGPFTASEARDFSALADRVARDYAGQDWVSDLIKLALFIFALYAIAELLKPKTTAA